MFSHVMLGANDLDASVKFYNALLGTLGAKPGVQDRHRTSGATRAVPSA